MDTNEHFPFTYLEMPSTKTAGLTLHGKKNKGSAGVCNCTITYTFMFTAT